MKKIAKRFAMIFLSALLIVTALPLGVSAAETWTNPFTDVKKSDWFYDAVKFMNYKGYISGTDKTKFSPGTTTSREMFVTILGRIVGVQASDYEGKSHFSDVKPGWSEPYIAWAAENDIVKGVGEGRFNPGGAVTRQQSATILYNYLVSSGYTPTTHEGALDVFDDAAKISEYARVPMQWIVSAGIVQGDGSGSVKPASTANRAQIAQILWKFVNHLAVLEGKEPEKLPEDTTKPVDPEPGPNENAHPNNIFSLNFDESKNNQVTSNSTMDSDEQRELISLLQGRTGNCAWNEIALQGNNVGAKGYTRAATLYGYNNVPRRVKKTALSELAATIADDLANRHTGMAYYCISLSDAYYDDGTTYEKDIYYCLYIINSPDAYVNSTDSTFLAKVKQRVTEQIPSTFVWCEFALQGGWADSDTVAYGVTEDELVKLTADYFAYMINEGWGIVAGGMYYIQIVPTGSGDKIVVYRG